MASMAGMFAVYHGPQGITRIALHAHGYAVAVADALRGMGYTLTADNFFDTLEVVADADAVRRVAERCQINLYYPSMDRVRMSFDEVTTTEEANTVLAILAEVAEAELRPITDIDAASLCVAPELRRTSNILTESVFEKYHDETSLMRYIKKLERRDISLANSMISLGSCTMKLNSASSMMPLSMAEFGNVHPFVPADQAAGYMEMLKGACHDLAVITGFDAVSVQPNSGAAGEYAGLMVIRAYHINRGAGHRNVALIPASAHGTNPASAAMAGMKIIIVACDENGNINVDDLRTKAEENKTNLSCIMITYPSTHGVFESRIREIVDIVHENGGQVYFDGANMNALVGLSSPGYIGADVCHLNLHKTFAMPHGGGGPGVGAIGVAKHLTDLLPTHPIIAAGGKNGITAVSAAPFGSASIMPITYAYIKMLGAEGLRRASEMAIVNANYIACALKGEFGVVYTGETGRVGHEMILDCRHYRKEYGVECADIARRLMDYGFHAPTLSFPVHETLMVEPTESEPKAELDRFIEALVSIKAECEEIKAGKADAEDNVLKMAPHTAPEVAATEWKHPYTREKAVYPLAWIAENKFFPYVSKIDGGYGDRNLVTSCCTIENVL